MPIHQDLSSSNIIFVPYGTYLNSKYIFEFNFELECPVKLYNYIRWDVVCTYICTLKNIGSGIAVCRWPWSAEKWHVVFIWELNSSKKWYKAF